MRVDRIAIDLSRRSMLEAADLGVRLVSAHARTVWSCWLPVWLLAVAISAVALEAGPGWAMLALFWLKPWLDRSILFVLARTVFREPTRFADLAAAWAPLWFGSLLATLTVRRLSPWRAFVQPAQQLEGLRGSALSRRVRLLLRRGRASALLMQSAFATVESCLTIAFAVLPAYFLPSGRETGWLETLFAGPSWAGGLHFACYAVTVAIVEPFFVGAGFASYLNRRVELEAWDIEQELRVVFAPA